MRIGFNEILQIFLNKNFKFYFQLRIKSPFLKEKLGTTIKITLLLHTEVAILCKQDSFYQIEYNLVFNNGS